jgi:hypothetical protein
MSESNITDEAESGSKKVQSALPPHLHVDLKRDRWEHFPEYPEYEKDVEPMRWPPGMVGHIAKYLYCHAPSPVPEYAIAAAIGFFAGICGRGWIYSGTGLNHDIIVLGNSGSGKNIIHQGLANLSRQLSGTPINTFIAPVKMASAPALIKSLAANPCFLQLIGEVGKMYRAYAKSRHGDNLDQLFTVKLDLWERSGPDGSGIGIMYSDSERNVQPGLYHGIAHSTLGESTQNLFYDSIDTNMMNEGLLSRLWIFEYEGNDPSFNAQRLHELPPEYLGYLSDLIRAASGRLNQQSIDHTADAEEAIRQFSEQCRDEKLNAGKNPAQRQLWVRAYEKVIRLAGLLAVADNYIAPVIQVEHVDWAVTMLLTTNLTVQRRVCDGDISDNSDHTRQQMILDRCKRWRDAPRKNPKEEELRNAGYVSRRFLQAEVSQKRIFKDHRLEAVGIFNLTMKNLVDSGYLYETNKSKFQERFGVNRGQCWLLVDNKLE